MSEMCIGVRWRLVLTVAALEACQPDGGLGAHGDGAELVSPPALEHPPRHDRFVQPEQPRVDVLFVVDESCSMYGERALLAQNAGRFFAGLVASGSDWQVGLTTMDMASGQPGTEGTLKPVGGVRFLTPDVADPEGVFETMVQQDVGSSFAEEGRRAAWTVLEQRRDEPANAGFLRDDASLHLVFVSDGEDDSPVDPIGPVAFVGWLDALKAAPLEAVAHAIAPVMGAGCITEEASVLYAGYASATGGTAQSVCDPVWSTFMDDLGRRASGLRREFFLSALPVLDPWTLRVEVAERGPDGVGITTEHAVCPDPPGDGCDLVYLPERNSVVFLDHLPGPHAEVHVRYLEAAALEPPTPPTPGAD